MKFRFLSLVKTALTRWRGDKLALAALAVTLAYLALAVAMETYAVVCRVRNVEPVYSREHLQERFMPPSGEHWMGTDYQGRDVFWRAMAGSATAVKVGVVASVIACLIGVTAGAAAGYFGGWVDEFIVFVYSVFAAMPTLLFILAFALLANKGFAAGGLAGAVAFSRKYLNSDPGMLAVYLAIGLTGWVTLCRVVRGETLKLKNSGYVQAAQVAGVGSWRIIARHIVPNVSHLIIIYFTLRFAYAIMTEVIVSYLGLGVRSAPSWGVMIADGQERLWRGIWWEVAAATLFMFFLVLALHTLGDKLRDVFDPRGRDRE